jgi:DNA-binding protein H-NS
MTDLVERLRTEAQEICSDTYPRWKNADETMNEAADKIEQLREQYDLVTTELRNKVTESHAREAKLQGAMNDYFNQYPHMMKGYILDALAMPTDDSALKEAIKQAKREEREACAKVCEAQRNVCVARHPARVEFDPDSVMALKCAAAIRARGKK